MFTLATAFFCLGGSCPALVSWPNWNDASLCRPQMKLHIFGWLPSNMTWQALLVLGIPPFVLKRTFHALPWNRGCSYFASHAVLFNMGIKLIQAPVHTFKKSAKGLRDFLRRQECQCWKRSDASNSCPWWRSVLLQPEIGHTPRKERNLTIPPIQFWERF